MDKRKLYESIMRNVAKTVKRVLNENINTSGMRFMEYAQIPNMFMFL